MVVVKIVLLVIRKAEKEGKKQRVQEAQWWWCPEVVFWRLAVTMILLHLGLGRFLLPVHVSIMFET